MPKTREEHFEDAIEGSLLARGYVKGDRDLFDRVLALDPAALFAFFEETQAKELARLKEIHGEAYQQKILDRLTTLLGRDGLLNTLRRGIDDHGQHLSLAFFRPASGINPETRKLYAANILTVTRQVHYSTKNENSIDLLLSVNGLPIVTIELKNQFTRQDATHAKRQYQDDRDPDELLFTFKIRALVQFAVDTDEVVMTTKLARDRTVWLPFNQGYENGAGNPPSDGYRTAYLWEDILARDSFMDLLARYVHLEVLKITSEGKTYTKETLIFPRYHQLDVVRRLEAAVSKDGVGNKYLIQHSAGSGKSNSIAWLAYRLSTLHDKKDEPVFDTVVVVSDRKVIDRQLQDTIYQFEHKQGVVQKIDKHSKQLAKSLSTGTKIIITTLQKFPFIIERIDDLPKRTYAVIVDEAHSSQGGEASRKMRQVLGDPDEAIKRDQEGAEPDIEDNIRAVMASRRGKKNLSFFGFTATPKPKTLEVFGTKDEDGKPAPFHLYSMRQAIEEGFILDVLENYTTYATYYRLCKAIDDDPKVNKRKAKRAIARFVSIHPHNIAQKTEVMIEHFRKVTMQKIGGKARAMVVTPSRPHVIKYKEAFDEYLKEHRYHDIKTIVAFTAFTDEGGIEYRETAYNDFSDSELPEKFRNTPEYRLLIVADKYQTGYDEPLLHTMYVDKKLGGVKAVQTLSRLNRTCPGKEDTFVLDFANRAEEIQEAFQPYYERTILSETADPNKLYDLKTQLVDAGIIWDKDVQAFAKIFFLAPDRMSITDHAKLNKHIDPAVDRYRTLDEEKQEDFKNTLTVFTRLYAFISQVMPFQDAELEKLYAYSRLLLTKLPKGTLGGQYKLGDEVALEYYRLQKKQDGSITLKKGEEGELKPVSEAGTKRPKDEQALLSEIIDVLNKRFGTDFTTADKLFFDQIEAELTCNETLAHQAKTNTLTNFAYGFDEVFMKALIGRMDQNQEIFTRIMDDPEFSKVVKDYLRRKVYKTLNQEQAQPVSE
jgi:type I restriction enzyme R subunit